MSLLKYLQTHWHTSFSIKTETATTQSPQCDQGLDSKPESGEPSESETDHVAELHATVNHSHPIYADGTLILVGDQIRSHNPIDGHYYEGQVAGVTSTSLLCIPMCDITLAEGICDSLYMTARAPRTQARQLSKLEIARLKLSRGDELSSEERAAVLEAVGRHRPSNIY
jgi:hypothetical protein